MLYQTDLYIRKTDLSGLYSDLAVKVHGYLMSRLPQDYAAELHEAGEHPFSLFCCYGEEYGIIRVSALDDRAAVIVQLLAETKIIRVFGTDRNISVFHASDISRVSCETLRMPPQYRRCRLEFRSPAMYRSGGVMRHEPSLPVYFTSVRKKLEAFEGVALSAEQTENAFRGVQYGEYRLEASQFLYGGRKMYGMTGSVELTLPREPEDAALLHLLFSYAAFSGVGAKTAQGCGGLTVQPLG